MSFKQEILSKIHELPTIMGSGSYSQGYEDALNQVETLITETPEK